MRYCSHIILPDAEGAKTIVRLIEIFLKLWMLSIFILNLPVTVQAEEERDILRQVDGLTEGLNEEQLEGIRRLIDSKIETIRTRQDQASTDPYNFTRTTEEHVKGQRLQLELEHRLFLYNLEGSDYKLRNARTFFGDILGTKLSYRLGEDATIKGGVVFILPFAEDNFDLRWGDYYRDFRPGDHSRKKVNLIQPYVQLRYDYHNFGFIFGDLETPHEFHKLVLYDVYEFLRPTEKGIQILYDGRLLSQDLFINWREKNTPGNHERFNAGSISKLKWRGGSLGLQVLYVHRGGEEFPQHPVVFENISAALVLDHSLPVTWSFIDRVGIEVVSLYTNDLPVGNNSPSRVDGFGALGSLYFTSGNWSLKSGYWRGTDKVLAEEGMPFSRTGRFVYSELIFHKNLKYNIDVQALLTGGLFGRNLKETFFDQKLVISWKHAFGLGS